MCGIVGAIAQRSVERILVEGLKRLEYRGYDSAGIALSQPQTQSILRKRVLGKVAKLEALLNESADVMGEMGIAHTRWATHGKPTENNAHPHCSDTLAVVHNGIIENHLALRKQLTDKNYQFESETDTEVIVHLLHDLLKHESNIINALKQCMQQLKGAFALCVLSAQDPHHIYAVRCGSPLVIGVGNDENFIASDSLALLPVTQQFIYLEEGDIAMVSRQQVSIYDRAGLSVDRKIIASQLEHDAANKGTYAHYMLKEIYEQPDTMHNTLESCLALDYVSPNCFGHNAQNIFKKIKRIQMLACGTSYHAALVAKHWMESIAQLPVAVDIASEFRYREHVLEPNTLFVAISQSGETADTLAAVRYAKTKGAKHVLAICNVPESSLTHESSLVFITRSGKEVGVAATKTFTTQLCALALLTLTFAKIKNIPSSQLKQFQLELKTLPQLAKQLLSLDGVIQNLSSRFITKNHALFIARGVHYPIALEGALKLKEISYIHAEAYPAGELKHGPLALVDENMPVIVLAPHNRLFEKLCSNIEEIAARGGDLTVFSDAVQEIFPHQVNYVSMPTMGDFISPIAYTLPMQLLSYHIAVLKGTDVDQPRNLAKSVTVE